MDSVLQPEDSGEKISAPNVKRLRSVTLHYKTLSPEQHNKRIHEPIHNMVYSAKKNRESLLHPFRAVPLLYRLTTETAGQRKVILNRKKS